MSNSLLKNSMKNKILEQINNIQYNTDRIFFMLDEDNNNSIGEIQLKFANKLLKEAEDITTFVKQFLNT